MGTKISTAGLRVLGAAWCVGTSAYHIVLAGQENAAGPAEIVGKSPIQSAFGPRHVGERIVVPTWKLSQSGAAVRLGQSLPESLRMQNIFMVP